MKGFEGHSSKVRPSSWRSIFPLSVRCELPAPRRLLLMRHKKFRPCAGKPWQDRSRAGTPLGLAGKGADWQRDAGPFPYPNDHDAASGLPRVLSSTNILRGYSNGCSRSLSTLDARKQLGEAQVTLIVRRGTTRHTRRRRLPSRWRENQNVEVG